MSVRPTPPTTFPLDRGDSRIARQLSSTALIVLVLGVLAIAWGASAVLQVIGCVVSVPLLVHTAPGGLARGSQLRRRAPGPRLTGRGRTGSSPGPRVRSG